MKSVHFSMAFYFLPKKLKIEPCFFPTGGEIFFFDAAGAALLVFAMAGFFGGGSITSGSSSEQLTSSISRTVSVNDNEINQIARFQSISW